MLNDILGKFCFAVGKLAGESLTDVVEDQEERRASFVNSLLNADGSGIIVPLSVTNNPTENKIQQPQVTEDKTTSSDSKVKSMLMVLFLYFVSHPLLRKSVSLNVSLSFKTIKILSKSTIPH